MKPYSAAEVAEMLGYTLDGFYRARQRLHAQDGLPLPIASKGRLWWHRPALDAWLDPRTRAIARPANDTLPPPALDTADIEHTRAMIARAYGSQT